MLDVIRHRFTFSSLLAAAAARPDPVWLLDGSFFFQVRIVILPGFDVRIGNSICDGPEPQGSK